MSTQRSTAGPERDGVAATPLALPQRLARDVGLAVVLGGVAGVLHGVFSPLSDGLLTPGWWRYVASFAVALFLYFHLVRWRQRGRPWAATWPRDLGTAAVWSAFMALVPFEPSALHSAEWWGDFAIRVVIAFAGIRLLRWTWRMTGSPTLGVFFNPSCPVPGAPSEERPPVQPGRQRHA